MEALVRDKGTVRLRRIDIDTWDSAVARQHKIRRLPKLVLYEGEKRVSDDIGEILQLIGQS